jgi:hypothetical protein
LWRVFKIAAKCQLTKKIARLTSITHNRKKVLQDFWSKHLAMTASWLFLLHVQFWKRNTKPKNKIVGKDVVQNQLL